MTTISEAATIWRLDLDASDLLETDGLVDRYSRHDPTTFEEMIQAAVATYETTFGSFFAQPFVRVLGPTGLRHFDIKGPGGLVDNVSMWRRDLPRLVKQTAAHVAVVATQGVLTPSMLDTAPGEPLGRANGILGIDCLDNQGKHYQAMCLVEVGARSARRLVPWRVASIDRLPLQGADNDPARTLRALAAHKPKRG